MTPLSGRGDGAHLEPAPEAIAPAGDEAVNGIGEDGWNETEEYGDGGPGLGQFANGGEDGAGADEDLGLGGEWLADNEDGVGDGGRAGWLIGFGE
jgi:hypothetical protein